MLSSNPNRNPAGAIRSRTATKRGGDLLLSPLILAISLPLVLVFMALIRITSGGPALFRQSRIGLDGNIFTCYKLRTLKVNPTKAFLREIPKDTLIFLGSFLRKSKIDELPQLFNVLRGEMTLVGPRPCVPEYSDVIAEREKYDVFSVVPGITGLAQINYVDMTSPKQLARMDAEYIRRQSVLFDFEILLRTFFVFFRSPLSRIPPEFLETGEPSSNPSPTDSHPSR